jgi:dihydroxy-acid dehydratase
MAANTNNKGGLRKGLTAYGDPEFSLFLRKIFIKALGYGEDALERPIVGVTDTASDFNPCHGNVPGLIEAVKRGVMLAGGLPMVFPTISLGESFTNPTSMYLRNLMAMETEEMLRAQPMDSVVLIGGCDKTVPAQLMAAASANIPAVQLVTGPMLAGTYRGARVGACTDCRALWSQYRAGELDADEIENVSARLAPTKGTCMVMGTASTMACLAETLGMTLTGTATIPATHADRLRAAERTGQAAVTMAKNGGPTPRQIITDRSIRNAMTVLQAIGGSTNAVIHLAALAGRLGLSLDLPEFDRLGTIAPVLVDLKPSGDHYLEDFHWAGGMPRLLLELGELIDADALTVTGQTLAQSIAAVAEERHQTVIRSRAMPLKPAGAIAVLFGNLAPRGAIIKHSAASPQLLSHQGRAIVFDSIEDLTRRIDDPDLDVDKSDILVLRNAGPKGAPGMPEAGYLPIPRKLLQQGVKDMVRISDARMSGTAFGTIVLHISPEAAIGGPLALVVSGDHIRLDVPARRLDLLVDEATINARKRLWRPPDPVRSRNRGYARLFQQAVLQAERGCDFDFLQDDSTAGSPD